MEHKHWKWIILTALLIIFEIGQWLVAGLMAKEGVDKLTKRR
jgi:hypothetical protein